jgi:hypothetical protein
MQARESLIASATTLLRTTSEVMRRMLPQEAASPLERRVQAVRRLVSRVAAGDLEVLIAGKPAVGTSSLSSTLATAVGAQGQACDNRFLFTVVGEATLDDPLADERFLSAFAVIVVLDSEPYAHEVARLERLKAAAPDTPIFVFVNKLDVLQYMHGAALPRVEARIRDKVAPFVTNVATDVVFGSAVVNEGPAAWTTAPIARLVSAALPFAEAHATLHTRLVSRVHTFVLAIREEAARLHVVEHAGVAARRPLRRATLADVAASVGAIMSVDGDEASVTSMVRAVQRRVGDRAPASWPWRGLADRLICAAPWSTAGIRRRRYSRVMGFGEAAIETARTQSRSAVDVLRAAGHSSNGHQDQRAI